MKTETGKRNILLWRRSLSAWLDFSLIWCVASLIQPLLWHLDYIPFTAILAGTFVGYYLLVYRISGGSTPGRVFLGLKLRGKEGDTVRLRDLLLREVIFKGGLGIWLPVLLFTTLPHGTVFYLTVFRMLMCLLFSVLFLLIFRKTWWEWLSGTRTFRESAVSRPRLTLALFTFVLLYLGTIALSITPILVDRANFQTSFRAFYPANREVEKYARYINHHRSDPVDYLFHLFETRDLVVISERMHPEYSQYEFFFRVISDPRFSRDVGNIFTECGSVSWQDSLDAYLRTPYPSEQELLKATARLARDNNAIWPLWSNTNLFDMFRKVHDVNAALPDSCRIRWYFTDLPVNWATATHASYLSNYTNPQRDKIMADRVTNVYRTVLADSRRHKALVIMNTYHGFGLSSDGKDHFKGTAAFIMKALPGKVATVLMNGVAQKYLWIFTPVADGKWDAAFRMAGDPPAGFDFAGSPFGDDEFDGRGWMVRGLRYKDMFTGLIFYTPLTRQYCRDGFPFMFDGAEQELIHRAGCVSMEHADIFRNLLVHYRKNPKDPVVTTPCKLPIFYNLIHGIAVPFLLFVCLSILLAAYFVKRRRLTRN